MNLIESIYNEPQEWRLTEHTFNHSGGAKLWVANGFFFIAPYPGGSFNLFDKFRAWTAFRWWQRNAPVQAFGFSKT